ncbi:putative GTP-binding protein, partial [Escherichia coli MA6]|uniref:DUF945 family protein n=1 Tax=Escherichia coli TaxID=562 RepID=UPI00028CEE88
FPLLIWWTPLCLIRQILTRRFRLYAYEKAQKQADKQISGMMTLGQMFQLITIDNNTASLQLRYTPGKVVFNGQEMSEEEFMSRAGRFVH